MYYEQELNAVNNCICIPYDMKNDKLESVCELLTKAQKLADRCSWTIVAICFGNDNEEQFHELIEFGAERIILFEKNEYFHKSEILKSMSEIVEKMESGLILFQDSELGKYVSSSLSVRFDIGLIADCINIQMNEKNGFIFSRTAIGDSVVADIISLQSKIYMCTIKSGAIIREKNMNRYFQGLTKYEIYSDGCEKENYEILGSISEEKQNGYDIQKYNIVFCLGRGVKKIETVERVMQLARIYKAGVCGTKAAVDEGWISKKNQVGQSAKCISPSIYIGLGVSGASQHLVGIQNSRKIIAINCDENAPIFQFADYVICGDVDEIIAKFSEMSCKMYVL